LLKQTDQNRCSGIITLDLLSPEAFPNILCSRFPDLQINALSEPSQTCRNGFHQMCDVQWHISEDSLFTVTGSLRILTWFPIIWT